jgi:hypothetical protein
MAVSPNHVPTIPGCSIEGIKPTIEAIPPDIVEQRKLKHEKSIGKTYGGSQRCCVCRGVPTKTAIYHVQGATIIERYCDSCIQKQSRG